MKKVDKSGEPKEAARQKDGPELVVAKKVTPRLGVYARKVVNRRGAQGGGVWKG